MIPNYGMKGILICSKGTLSTSPANAVVSGFRSKGAKLTIADEAMVEDYRGRQFQNKIKFSAEFTSLQFGLGELNKILTILKSSDKIADVQVATALPYAGTTATQLPNEGIFNFVGTQGMGLEFEFLRSLKENSCKITAAASYSVADAKALMLASKTNTPNTLLTAAAGEDITKIIPPNYSEIYFGVDGQSAPVALAPRFEVYSMEAKFKLKTDKTVMDIAIPIMVEHDITIELLDSSPDKIYQMLNVNNERVGIDVLKSTGWESYIFPANTLMYKTESEIGEDKRLVKLNFKGGSYLADAVYTSNQQQNSETLTLY